MEKFFKKWKQHQSKRFYLIQLVLHLMKISSKQSLWWWFVFLHICWTWFCLSPFPLQFHWFHITLIRNYSELILLKEWKREENCHVHNTYITFKNCSTVWLCTGALLYVWCTLERSLQLNKYRKINTIPGDGHRQRLQWEPLPCPARPRELQEQCCKNCRSTLQLIMST